MNRPTILGRYRELQMELNGFVQKVTELEESRNEHRCVICIWEGTRWTRWRLVRLHFSRFRTRMSHTIFVVLTHFPTMDLYTRRLVEETLTPLDSHRRAFRLVGGVLVERTVGEVLPNVAQNRSNVSAPPYTASNGFQTLMWQSYPNSLLLFFLRFVYPTCWHCSWNKWLRHWRRLWKENKRKPFSGKPNMKSQSRKSRWFSHTNQTCKRTNVGSLSTTLPSIGKAMTRLLLLLVALLFLPTYRIPTTWHFSPPK